MWQCQITNGAMIRSADALKQFESIMDFPPFQGDIELGKAIWETPLPSGATYADCLPNRGVNIAGHYPIFDERSKKLISFEMLINDCLEKNGGVAHSFDDRKTMGALLPTHENFSDGMSMDIKVESEAALQKFGSWSSFYFKRIGQHNLACDHVTLLTGASTSEMNLFHLRLDRLFIFQSSRAGERLLHITHAPPTLYGGCWGGSIFSRQRSSIAWSTSTHTSATAYLFAPPYTGDSRHRSKYGFAT